MIMKKLTILLYLIATLPICALTLYWDYPYDKTDLTFVAYRSVDSTNWSRFAVTTNLYTPITTNTLYYYVTASNVVIGLESDPSPYGYSGCRAPTGIRIGK
jgi:hypothetical protein